MFGVCLEEEKNPRNISDYITTLWLFLFNCLLEVQKALVSFYAHPGFHFQPLVIYKEKVLLHGGRGKKKLIKKTLYNYLKAMWRF